MQGWHAHRPCYALAIGLCPGHATGLYKFDLYLGHDWSVPGSRNTRDGEGSAPGRGRACGSVACEMMEQTLSSWPVRQCTCILCAAARSQGDTTRCAAGLT